MTCKLYLVPEDVINSWRSEQRESAVDKPIDTTTRNVDSVMTNLLKKDISEYDKEKLFSQELAKYLALRDQRHVVHGHQQSPQPQNVMASIPKMYKSKAAGLLEFLQADQDVSWDDKGQLYIGQQKIDNSHIVDLIHDAMRLRKKVKRPLGWRELSSHLRSKNIPKELVGNPKWFTPQSSPQSTPLSTPPTTPIKTKGIKRVAFKQYITPAKKRVIGHILPTPISIKKPRKSKVQGQKKIKQWISV